SPTPPANGVLPQQERGTRPARPIAYDLEVVERSRPASVAVTLVNRGGLGAQFQARFLASDAPPRSYTVRADDALSAEWPTSGPYDITLHGPNGVFRRLTGNRADDPVETSLRTRGGAVVLAVRPAGDDPVTVTVTNAYNPDRPRTLTVKDG